MQDFHFKGQQPDGQPLGQFPAFNHAVNQYATAHVTVMDDEEWHTARQRRWYKGICLKGLSEWNGDTADQWDWRLKSVCGSELFKFRPVEYNGMHMIVADSITHRTKRQMTEFIENILAKAIEKDWPVYPPDPELRRQA